MMSNKQITILGIIKAKQGMEEKLKQAISATIAPARSEQGCIIYDINQGLEDKSRFMSYQKWESMEDMERHRNMPYMKEYLSTAGEMLDGNPEIALWNIIEVEKGKKTVIGLLEQIAESIGE